MHSPSLWISMLAAGSMLMVISRVASAVVNPPDVDPADFVPGQVINNRYFPLREGTLFLYDGEKDGIPSHDEICVTSQKRPPIEGVEVTVVHHQSFENGIKVENTFDWFAQDIHGNVWYLGEDTTDLTNNSKEGSWEAGVNDADAGFIMLAHPRVGDRYYQEFARNVAEDQAKVLSLSEAVCLTSGKCYDNVLLTKETSRLDPGVVEYKYYALDVGQILGVVLKGGDERTELIGIGTCTE